MKSIRRCYPKWFWHRKPKRWRQPQTTRTKGNPLVTRTRSLLNKKAATKFIKENGKHITQVESTFYTLLDQKIKDIILRAIARNASRHRLSQYELMGTSGSNKTR